MTITELVKNNTVHFDSYRAGFFYYNIVHSPSQKGTGGSMIPQEVTYQFTVPVEDVAGATLLATDKAITFMRWIRKAMEDGTLQKVNQLYERG